MFLIYLYMCMFLHLQSLIKLFAGFMFYCFMYVAVVALEGLSTEKIVTTLLVLFVTLRQNYISSL